jgi:hypothetical protein
MNGADLACEIRHVPGIFSWLNLLPVRVGKEERPHRVHSTQSDLYEDLGVRSANEREWKFLARTIQVTCRACGTMTNLDGEVAMIDIEWSWCISCCTGSIDVSGGCQADLLLLPCTRRGESLRW